MVSHPYGLFDSRLANYYYLGVWYHQKLVRLAELHNTARFVKDAFILRSMDAIFIFDDGYILLYDVYQYKPIWAAKPTGQMYDRLLSQSLLT